MPIDAGQVQHRTLNRDSAGDLTGAKRDLLLGSGPPSPKTTVRIPYLLLQIPGVLQQIQGLLRIQYLPRSLAELNFCGWMTAWSLR